MRAFARMAANPVLNAVQQVIDAKILMATLGGTRFQTFGICVRTGAPINAVIGKVGWSPIESVARRIARSRHRLPAMVFPKSGRPELVVALCGTRSQQVAQDRTERLNPAPKNRRFQMKLLISLKDEQLHLTPVK